MAAVGSDSDRARTRGREEGKEERQVFNGWSRGARIKIGGQIREKATR